MSGAAPREPVPAVTPDLPSLPWRAIIGMLERLPQASLSRALGNLADIPIPSPLRRPLLGAFARVTGIDASEAEHSLDVYGSVNQFFVRRLRPGVRAWPRTDAIASPVDGIIGQHGRITNGRLIQAKGRDYSTAALLAEDAARYEGGTFVTIYLSPRHYHRIHAPCRGEIGEARYVPGALLPVNEPGVLHVADLFPRSERVICPIDGPFGRVTVVAVGAYNVGRISTAFDPEWAGEGASVANRTDIIARTRRYDPARPVQQGDEIMAFHLGSTIVMLCEAGLADRAPAPGTEVRLGALLLERST